MTTKVTPTLTPSAMNFTVDRRIYVRRFTDALQDKAVPTCINLWRWALSLLTLDRLLLADGGCYFLASSPFAMALAAVFPATGIMACSYGVPGHIM